MVLNAIFMAVLSWGPVGAAAAAAIIQILGGIIPIFYFRRTRSGVLRLTKTKLDGKAILKACTNGSSELKGLLNKRYFIIGFFAVAMFGLAELAAAAMTVIFIAAKRGKYHY